MISKGPFGPLPSVDQPSPFCEAELLVCAHAEQKAGLEIRGFFQSDSGTSLIFN